MGAKWCGVIRLRSHRSSVGFYCFFVHSHVLFCAFLFK